MFNKNQKSLISIVVVMLALFLLMGCASKKAFWGNEKTGFILTYRMDKDQALTYKITSTTSMAMEAMGQAMDINMDLKQTYSVKSNGTDDKKNLLTTITIDDISYKVDGPQGNNSIDLKSVIGKSFDLAFGMDGKSEKLTGANELKFNMGQMSGGETDIASLMRDVMQDLPSKPIKVGDTWPSKDEKSIKNMGMDVKTVSEMEHKCEAIETVNDLECLKIVSKIKSAMSGSGEQMGMEMNMEGDAETVSTWYFAYKKGIIVKTVQDGFVESTIAMSGQQNMTIPVTTEIKSELSLVPGVK
jgi:hypothetical protein